VVATDSPSSLSVPELFPLSEGMFTGTQVGLLRVCRISDLGQEEYNL
jgi:hypothetical protein